MSKRKKPRAKRKPLTVTCQACGRQHIVGVESFGWCPSCPPNLTKEARASISLDGDTHCCMACLGEHVTVRMDGKRLDEIVGYGAFHLEALGGSWFLDLGGRRMNLTTSPRSEKALAIDDPKGEFHAGSIARPGREHVCGKRAMTSEEQMLIDEIVRACEIDPSRHTPYVQGLAAKIRAERKEKKR